MVDLSHSVHNKMHINNQGLPNEPYILLLWVHCNKLLNSSTTNWSQIQLTIESAVTRGRQGLWLFNPYILNKHVSTFHEKYVLNWRIKRWSGLLNLNTTYCILLLLLSHERYQNIIYAHLKSWYISSSSSFKCKHR